MNEKPIFQFYMPDGSIGTERDIPSLPEPIKSERLQHLEAHYKGIEYYERKWRNEQLSKTDYLMIPDATHNKRSMRDTPEGQQIKEYRHALRDYDCSKQARPVTPSWLSV